MRVTTEYDRDPLYQPLTTFFGQDWPARDTRLLPDLYAFDSDRRSQSRSIPPHNMQSKRTSRATTIPHHAVPHDVPDEEFLASTENTSPSDNEEPIDFDDILFDTEFDQSCLYPLDKELLLHPIETFIDVCWDEAVVEDEVIAEDNATPRRQSPPLYAPSYGSIDYQFHPEDGDLTPTDGRSEDMSVKDTKNFVHFAQDSFSKTEPSSPLSTSTDDSRHVEMPVVYLNAHFPVCNPSESIHFFPVSPLASRRRAADRKLPHARIAAFCSNLPGRLVKSASAA